VTSGEATRWIWLKDVAALDHDEARRVLEVTPRVRIAIGTTARGVEGFRRSHEQAIAAQQTMLRLHSRQQVAFYDDIRIVALLTQKPERAEDFIADTLGPLASASAVVRDTLLTYINEQCNANRTAQQLYIHRNTLQGRLDAAQRLLPRPLDRTTVRVAVALEALKWTGNQDKELSNHSARSK
jgi:DNA-binding PucR family transcriptional regulator